MSNLDELIEVLQKLRDKVGGEADVRIAAGLSDPRAFVMLGAVTLGDLGRPQEEGEVVYLVTGMATQKITPEWWEVASSAMDGRKK